VSRPHLLALLVAVGLVCAPDAGGLSSGNSAGHLETVAVFGDSVIDADGWLALERPLSWGMEIHATGGAPCGSDAVADVDDQVTGVVASLVARGIDNAVVSCGTNDRDDFFDNSWSVASKGWTETHAGLDNLLDTLATNSIETLVIAEPCYSTADPSPVEAEQVTCQILAGWKQKLAKKHGHHFSRAALDAMAAQDQTIDGDNSNSWACEEGSNPLGPDLDDPVYVDAVHYNRCGDRIIFEAEQTAIHDMLYVDSPPAPVALGTGLTPGTILLSDTTIFEGQRVTVNLDTTGGELPYGYRVNCGANDSEISDPDGQWQIFMGSDSGSGNDALSVSCGTYSDARTANIQVFVMDANGSQSNTTAASMVVVDPAGEDSIAEFSADTTICTEPCTPTFTVALADTGSGTTDAAFWCIDPTPTACDVWATPNAGVANSSATAWTITPGMMSPQCLYAAGTHKAAAWIQRPSVGGGEDCAYLNIVVQAQDVVSALSVENTSGPTPHDPGAVSVTSTGTCPELGLDVTHYLCYNAANCTVGPHNDIAVAVADENGEAISSFTVPDYTSTSTMSVLTKCGTATDAEDSVPITVTAATTWTPNFVVQPPTAQLPASIRVLMSIGGDADGLISDILCDCDDNATFEFGPYSWTDDGSGIWDSFTEELATCDFVIGEEGQKPIACKSTRESIVSATDTSIVTLTAPPPIPAIGVQPDSYSFVQLTTDPDPAPVSFTFTDQAGGDALGVTVLDCDADDPSACSDSSWLGCPAFVNQPSGSVLTCTVDTSGMSTPGTYKAYLEATDPTAINSPYRIPAGGRPFVQVVTQAPPTGGIDMSGVTAGPYLTAPAPMVVMADGRAATSPRTGLHPVTGIAHKFDSNDLACKESKYGNPNALCRYCYDAAMCAHIYETPGVYNFTDTARTRPGDEQTATHVVTVQDPDTYWGNLANADDPGRTPGPGQTWCLSKTGTYPNPATGHACSIVTNQLPASSTYSSLGPCITHGDMRCLVEPGQTFTHTGASHSVNKNVVDGHTLLAAWTPDASKARLKKLGNGHMFKVGDAGMFRVQDLELEGPAVNYMGIFTYTPRGESNPGPASKLVTNRVDIVPNSADGGFDFSNTYLSVGDNRHSYIFIFHTKVVDIGWIGGIKGNYAAYLAVDSSAIFGSWMQCQSDSVEKPCEHSTRTKGFNGFIVDSSDYGPGQDGKSAMTLRNTNWTGTYPGAGTWATDAIIMDSTYNPGAKTGFNVVDASQGDWNVKARRINLTRNRFFYEAIVPGHIGRYLFVYNANEPAKLEGLNSELEGVAVRYSICNVTGMTELQHCISGNSTRNVRDDVQYNNSGTSYDNAAAPNGIKIGLSKSGQGSIFNNLAYTTAVGSSALVAADVQNCGPESGRYCIESNNLRSTTSNPWKTWPWVDFTDDIKLHSNAGQQAAGTGRMVPGVNEADWLCGYDWTPCSGSTRNIGATGQ
jgi:hypothetical protein